MYLHFVFVSSWVTRTTLEIFSQRPSLIYFFFFKKKMGKQRFKTIKLILKLMLLFKIYSLHKFEADATQIAIPKSCDGCNETGLNSPISEKKTLNSVLDRSKRPARLIPLRIIL